MYPITVERDHMPTVKRPTRRRTWRKRRRCSVALLRSSPAPPSTSVAPPPSSRTPRCPPARSKPNVARRVCMIKKVKVAHARLPSAGFRSWSRFLAVSLQVTWIINPTAGCHYFPPGLQLPPQPLRRLLPTLLLCGQRHNGCEQFA